MKQYLWLGIAAIFVSAHASDNPFELKSNFGQLDQDQEVLLDDLKKMAEAKELAEDAMDDIPEEISVEEAAETVASPEATEALSESLTAVVEEEDTESE